MKHLTIPVLLAESLIALSAMEAGAVVCAHGVVHAGCVAAGRGCRRDDGARGDSAGHPVLPVRMPRCGRPLFGAGCTDRPRRIRMPRQRYAAETELALRRTSLKLRPIKLVALLLDWTTNRETAAASQHW
jgi:hypothetical protein